jgi:hypothetical protein
MAAAGAFILSQNVHVSSETTKTTLRATAQSSYSHQESLLATHFLISVDDAVTVSVHAAVMHYRIVSAMSTCQIVMSTPPSR